MMAPFIASIGDLAFVATLVKRCRSASVIAV